MPTLEKTYRIPAISFALRDQAPKKYADKQLYFSDLYKMFLDHVVKLPLKAKLEDAEAKKLTRMLEELIEMKKVLDSTLLR